MIRFASIIHDVCVAIEKNCIILKLNGVIIFLDRNMDYHIILNLHQVGVNFHSINLWLKKFFDRLPTIKMNTSLKLDWMASPKVSLKTAIWWNLWFKSIPLNSHFSDVEIVSSMHFNLGQCQTIVPLVATDGSWKSYGFSMILHHDISTINDSTSDIPPGWHMFIHEPKENFTGKNKILLHKANKAKVVR